MFSNLKIEVIDIPDKNDIKMVRLSGDLDALSAEFFKQRLFSEIERGFFKIIIDMRDLHFIDSVGTLSIISVHMKTVRCGSNLKVFGISDKVKEIFDVLGLGRLVYIYDSYQQALNSFK